MGRGAPSGAARAIGPPRRAWTVLGRYSALRPRVHRERFAQAMDWSMALRMGDGGRLSVADGLARSPNGLALMAEVSRSQRCCWSGTG